MIPLHAKQLIEAVKATGKRLTKMEEGFVSSISIQSGQNRLLTQKQAKYLQDIYSKVSGGGQYANKEFIG